MDHLIPEEVSLSKQNVTMLTPINELTYKGLRELSAGIANFLNVTFDTPNFLCLVEKYCQELQLPSKLNCTLSILKKKIVLNNFYFCFFLSRRNFTLYRKTVDSMFSKDEVL